MQVDTNVDEADVGRVKVGQAASFTVDAFPDRTFTGEVVQVRKAPQVVQNVVTYDVVVSAKNADQRAAARHDRQRAHRHRPERAASCRCRTRRCASARPASRPPSASGPRGPAAPGGGGGRGGGGPAGRVVGHRPPTASPPRSPLQLGIGDGDLHRGDRRRAQGGPAGDRGRRACRATGAPRAAGSRAAPPVLTMADALIETVDLVKDYHLGLATRPRAARRLDRRSPPGEFVAMMGPSGSGKSTFMNMLGCLDTADARAPTGSTASTSRASAATRWPRSATRRSASSSRASTCCRAPARSRTSSCRCSTARPPAARAAPRARASARPRSGLAGARAPPPGPALGRPAAAGGDRPRPGQRPGAHPGRRADRQPRLADRASRSWPSSRSSTATGMTVVRGDPRAGHRRATPGGP